MTLLPAVLLSAVLPVPVPVLGGPAVLESGFVIEEQASGLGNLTQIVFGPDGRLYGTTLSGLVRVLDYDADGVAGSPSTVAQGLGAAMGLAFDDEGALYVSGNAGIGIDDSGYLARLRDTDRDGFYETQDRFVTALPTALHHNNQLVIDGQRLYFGMGSRTDDGLDDGLLSFGPAGPALGAPSGGAAGPAGMGPGGPGAVQPGGRLAGLAPFATGVPPATVLRLDLDLVDFGTVNNPPRVYARGLRNAYGIALDEQGRVWVGDNGPDETSQLPDELHLVKPGRHHGFPAPLAPPDAVACVADLGCGTSADGLAVYPAAGPWGPAYAGDLFVARFSPGINGAAGQGRDVVRVELSGDPADPVGAVTIFADGFTTPLDVEVDPFGQLVVMDFQGRLYRVSQGP